MWQWVIATEDRSAAAFTTHTVCRTGDKADTPPECNYWMCANKDCSKCKPTEADKLLDFIAEAKKEGKTTTTEGGK